MAEGAGKLIMAVITVVVGALIGSFIGGFIGHVFPSGAVHDLFAKEITAGLEPTLLNLRVVEFTFGCIFKFNVPSVIGIVLAAYLLRKVAK